MKLTDEKLKKKLSKEIDIHFIVKKLELLCLSPSSSSTDEQIKEMIEGIVSDVDGLYLVLYRLDKLLFDYSKDINIKQKICVALEGIINKIEKDISKDVIPFQL